MGIAAAQEKSASPLPWKNSAPAALSPRAASVITALAANIFPTSSMSPSFPNFSLSFVESIHACKAAASPAAPKGFINISDSAMFAANEYADIFTGVLVSFDEWNPRVAKVAIEKNGKPDTAAITTGVQISTSLALKTPH